ncbi:MAG TPA: F0F1 ATP synthase subunit B' [Methylovirgula sp.]|nr:F0F1 ATP synthase subunit B' [Methylovirgula sp.]
MASTYGTSTEQPAAAPAGDKTFPPFDSANFASLLLWLVVFFGGLYLLMSRLALPRVANILRARQDKISGDVNEATAKRAAADQAAADYQKTLAEARANAQAIAQQTYVRLAAETEAKRKAHEADLAAKLAAAEAKIEATKSKAMAHVEEIAHEAASAIVEHITGKPADPKAIASALTKAKS